MTQAKHILIVEDDVDIANVLGCICATTKRESRVPRAIAFRTCAARAWPDSTAARSVLSRVPVAEVFEKFELAAQARRISLRAQIASRLPDVHADLGMIERTMTNQLDNAI